MRHDGAHDRLTLEYIGGPLDGRPAAVDAPAEITRGFHRYVLTKDDTGALFYEYRGVVSPTFLGARSA